MIELDRYWENPRWLARGRVPAGAYSIPFPAGDVRKLDVLQRASSDCYRSLSGGWRQRVYPNWGALPGDFISPGGSTSAWAVAMVPSGIPCIGADSTVPFCIDPPYIPWDTPVAAYVRDFELPKSWAEDREIHFVLEGVRSCCFLWVNGSLVGYSQGSGLPSEFVITPWLGSGKNRIAVAVFAWCDGSYLESYGAPWGLVRDVYVLARHKGHVRDVWIRAEKGMGEAQFLCEVTADGEGSVEAVLLDQDGSIVDSQSEYVEAESPCEIRLHVPSPRLWSPRDPYTYQIQIRKGKEALPYTVGIREPFDKKQWEWGILQPENSRTIEELWRLLSALKRQNRSAIFLKGTADPRLVELCSRIGLYVVESADIQIPEECREIADDPVWREAFLERMTRMVERDKNQVCIIGWGAGADTELDGKANIKAMEEWVERRDAERSWQPSERTRLEESNGIEKTPVGWHRCREALRQKLNIWKTEGIVYIEGEEILYTFHLGRGAPMQLQYQGMNMMQRFPEMVMWEKDGKPVQGWNVHEVQIYDERPEKLHFMTKYSLGTPGCRPVETGQAKWTFQPDGGLYLWISPQLCRQESEVALCLTVPQWMERLDVEYCGSAGPGHSGQVGDEMGIWLSNVQWASVTNIAGLGLYFESDRAMSVRLQDFQTEDGVERRLYLCPARTKGKDCHLHIQPILKDDGGVCYEAGGCH